MIRYRYMPVETPGNVKDRREREILWLFDATLVLKLIGGAFNILEAMFVATVPPAVAIRIVTFLTRGELAENPGGLLATALRAVAHSFAIHAHYLIALYLFLHGATKIALVLGILAGKKIAYPLFMLGVGLFGSYEAYRGLLRGEPVLLVFAFFDFVVLILTAYEYRRRYSASRPSAAVV